MKLSEFFCEIFFKSNPLPLKDLVKNLGELNARTILAGVGLDGIYLKLKDITEQSVATAMSLNLFAKATGLPIEGVQHFSNAVAQMGGNAEEAMGDLAALHKRLVELKLTGRADSGLAQANYLLNQAGTAVPYGVTDPIAMLERIRHGYQKLNKEKQLMVRSNLNISASSAMYLEMSDREVAASRRNAVVNQEQVRILTQLGGKWAEQGQIMRVLGVDIAQELTPSLLRLSEVFISILSSLETSGSFKKLGDFLFEASVWADALALSIGDIANFEMKTYEFLDKIDKEKAKPQTAGQALMAMTSVNPFLAAAGGQGTMQNNTFTIAVHATTEGAKDIAQKVADEIEKVMKRTTAQAGGKTL